MAELIRRLTFVVTQTVILQVVKKGEGTHERCCSCGWNEPLTPYGRICDRMSLTIS